MHKLQGVCKSLNAWLVNDLPASVKFGLLILYNTLTWRHDNNHREYHVKKTGFVPGKTNWASVRISIYAWETYGRIFCKGNFTSAPPWTFLSVGVGMRIENLNLWRAHLAFSNPQNPSYLSLSTFFKCDISYFKKLGHSINITVFAVCTLAQSFDPLLILTSERHSFSRILFFHQVRLPTCFKSTRWV